MQNQHKIRDSHLSRSAYVYVRQSSQYQVEHNLESQRLQYDLATKAKDMGFNDVVVVDEDLAVSAAGHAERRGFKRLVAAVSTNLAGIVLGTETARLARNGRDWHQLLDLCALFDTLLVEQGAVYDPADASDRMVLSMKGTMSEMELGVMRSRLLNGARNKAERGELISCLPVGYVKTNDGKIEKDPDTRVQESITQVFSKFRETRSVGRTFSWFIREQIAFPSRQYGRFGLELVWKTPVYGSILRVLKNPTYAGAYAHGMRETRKRLENGEIRKTRGHAVDMENWRVLIKDHHQSYISWAEYEDIQSVLRENAKRHGQGARGPILQGGSLLAGMLRCRRCGRRLQTTYGGKAGRVPRYQCKRRRAIREKQYCLGFGGARIDRAVSAEVLKVVEPIAIEAAIDAIEDDHRDINEKKRLVALELEGARYEERRAYHQYNAAEPGNRLVCRELEAKWNECLKRIEDIQARLNDLDRKIVPLCNEAKAEIMRLADDLPDLWNAPTTTDEMRKRIIRTVIEEIIVDVDDEMSTIAMNIHWIGGIHTKLTLRKSKTGEHNRSTDKSVVEIVTQLAKQLPDERIAPILNKHGFTTGAGNRWTRERVTSLRSHNAIPRYSSTSPHRFVNLTEAAESLGISPNSVLRLIEQKEISGHQVVPYAPWAIPIQELDRAQVKEAACRIKRCVSRRRQSPQNEHQQSLFIEESTT